MKELIVTADDFGLAREVNEAVETAHRNGILTSASLMVGAPAAEDAVSRARLLPSLKVGLHVVLVEGRPLSPPGLVPDLVGPDGAFRADMVRAGIAIFAIARVRRQVEAEIVAQFERFAATGLPLDHVDAHKHFHLHPAIGDILCRIGGRYGLTAVRAPLEPAWLLRQIDGTVGVSARATAPLAARLMRRLRRRGYRTADRVFGLAWSGALTAPRLAGLLTRLPDGVSEIYGHPATSDHFDGAARGYRYAEELAALCARGVVTAIAANGIRLSGYSNLLDRRSPRNIEADA